MLWRRTVRRGVVPGPLNHLLQAENRIKATLELRRVLKSNGAAFAALMMRCSFLCRIISIPTNGGWYVRAQALLFGF